MLTALALAVALAAPAVARPAAVRATSQDAPAPVHGAWRAWLASPGGELPFGLELALDDGAWSAVIENGVERIAVPSTSFADGTLVLDLAHYASTLTASVSDDGRRLDGAWQKRIAGGALTRMDFHAEAGAAPRFRPIGGGSAALSTEALPAAALPASALTGRWSVRFASEDEPAVGVFELAPDQVTVTGTFLTTTGDYRWLAGTLEGGRLRLSCFDGAHAFLFDATLGADGTLSGDFWSRDASHDTWTATRDDDAELADGWSLVGAAGDPALALQLFPVLDPRRSGDGLAPISEVALTGYPLVIEAFGSWCPNCHDAGAFLSGLRRRQPRVRLVGLAFELTGQRALDEPQVRRYLERHALDMDHVLLAGTADKARASRALLLLERLEAFPTLVLVDRIGRVRDVYTGFSGPGTGVAYERLAREIEDKVTALVAERPDIADVEALLCTSEWRDERDGAFVFFRPGAAEPDPDPWKRASRSGTIEVFEALRFDRPTSREPVRSGFWFAWGNSLHTQLSDVSETGLAPVEQLDWHLDRRAGVLLDARDFGHRLTPAARPRIPVLDGVGKDAPLDLAEGLASPDPLWRREACYHVALRVADGDRDGGGRLAGFAFDPTPLVDDADTWVRCVAAWAAGHCRVEGARDALVRALGDGNPSLRREAARALGKLASGRTAAAELAALADDYDPLVRAAAAEALAAFGDD